MRKWIVIKLVDEVPNWLALIPLLIYTGYKANFSASINHIWPKGRKMTKAGDVFENPVTGEYGYVRVGTEESNGRLVVSDLRVRPGGAVLGAHYHPTIDERFTVLEGQINYMKNGQQGVLKPGESADMPRGTPHDFWNAGTEEARVIVEIRPAARFEEMTITLFGLAWDGKTNKKGMANPLQMAVIGQEFADVVVFLSPPPKVQRVMFAVLAPLGRLLGYKASYPHHRERPIESVEVEPLPEWVVIAGVPGSQS